MLLATDFEYNVGPFFPLDPMKQSSFKFIDLFAGLGGFHLALSRVGGNCVFASEIDSELRTLYQKNFGITPHGDIKKVDFDIIPDHDLLTAGFPCQPFSKAGDQLGFSCTSQGDLFFEVVKILKIKKPNFFILENVPNLLTHNEGKTWKEMKKELEYLNYQVDARKLSPHNFGIPQIRERVYIIGSLSGLPLLAWPEVVLEKTTIMSVLDKNNSLAKKVSPSLEACIESWNNFLKKIPSNKKIPSFPLWSMEWGATYPFEGYTPYYLIKHKGKESMYEYFGSHGASLENLTEEEILKKLPSHARNSQNEFPKWKIDFIRKNRMFYEEHKSWLQDWMPEILSYPSSLQKLEWNAQGEKREIWDYILQIRASGIRVKRIATAPSLVAMTDTQVPIIGWEKRYMTPVECARLQSLEGLEALPQSNGKAFKALGNAVNSKVVEMITRTLLSETLDDKQGW